MPPARVLIYRIFTFLCLLVFATFPMRGATAVQVESGAESPRVQFAQEKLEQALQSAHDSIPSSVTRIRLEIKAGERESYAIENSGTKITIRGGDDRGLMYGTLRLAEEIRLGKRLESVRNESRSPFIKVRAFKFNLPLPGTLYLSQRNLKNNQWFWKMDYWRSFLDTLAEDRYNALEFWSAEPWSEMISLPSFSGTSSGNSPQSERNIRFFRKIFRMAKDRGIDTYVVTWNIDLPPAFAHAHHIPATNVDSPMVRNYLRSCVKTLLETYPDLTGLGTTQGEQMDVIPVSERAGWIADVYFRGIEDSGRKNVPFILRYWGGAPQDTERAAAMYHNGPVYLDIKYNGEHAYSSPFYHVQDSAWLKQTHVYKVLWHLRNDDIYTLRWGNPEFVRELMVNMAATHPAGFSYGSEIDIPGQDDYDTPTWEQGPKPTYEFQKQWFLFALWGRLAYNPDVPNDLWRRYFRVHYGLAGNPLYDSTVAAGRVAPLITSFHWNYMNGDWSVEGSIGSWNTSAEQPRLDYRRLEMYHGIRTYIFNNTIDDTLEDIPSYAARVLTGRSQPVGIQTPLDVATALEWDGHAALAAGKIPRPGGRSADAFKRAQLDDLAYGYLSLYYAEKVRAATDLALYLFNGKSEYKAASIRHLESALANWRKLVTVTDKAYRPREIWLFGPFHWNLYSHDVQNDIAIARQQTAFKPEAQTWQVAEAGASNPQWKTITLHGFNSFSLEGLHPWLVYVNQQFNVGRVGSTLPGASKIFWKGQFKPHSGYQLILEFATGAGLPTVKVNGKTIKPLSPGIEGVQSYFCGGGGELEVTAPAGQIPQASFIAVPLQNNRIEFAANTPEKVNKPVVNTAGGFLRLPKGAELSTASKSGESAELNTSGAAYYNFRVPSPGFYKLSCRIRSLTSAGRALFVAIDNYHGHAGSVAGTPSTHWQWISLDQPLELGTGEHTLRVTLLQAGTELSRIRLEATGDTGH